MDDYSTSRKPFAPPLQENSHNEPILIIGAGRGGIAMIELFYDELDVRIVGVADTNPDAPGLVFARKHGIQTYLDIDEALKANSQCFVINLTHDEEVSEQASLFVGADSVMGGHSAKLFWTVVTRLKTNEEKTRMMAQYDHLTGLPNRCLFYERLGWGIKNAKRHEKKLAALFLDLDGFKQVNDVHGHEAGDRLLVEVSRRLQKSVRESDTVARIGGDEFIIMEADVTNNPGDVDIVANKVLEAMCKPFILEDIEYQIGMSIGIAIYPDDAKKADDLVRLADDAMYLAKKNGKNNIKHYRDVIAVNGKSTEG